MERQLTTSPHGHVLTNANVWSPDSQWIVYDTRSDPAGSNFDDTRIERVHVPTGKVQVLYESSRDARCGVATYHPLLDQVIFIHGPENPTPDWQYAPYHRRGVIVRTEQPGVARNVDACDITPPFTPGALRGGSHVHVFSGDGQWISFTYEDAVLAKFDLETAAHHMNLRGVGVSVSGRPVIVSRTSPRNHDGSHFSVLVTTLHADAKAGSDQIRRAYEDAWVGTNGYIRPDGTRHHRAIAFQGEVRTAEGNWISEVFIVDLPDDPTTSGDGPLQGTATHRPAPPRGTTQRRLTYTQSRQYPGIANTPRHWLRSSPDGSQIAFLMRDDAGITQLWTVSPHGTPPRQITRNPHPISSAFTWSPDGRHLAHTMDNSVCITEASSGCTQRLTARTTDEESPRPEACVFSPDGERIVFVRNMPTGSERFNQICLVDAMGVSL
jgi:Protein of unknown function (DUF3748)/WD40-like Beta Propeller Repeat